VQRSRPGGIGSRIGDERPVAGRPGGLLPEDTTDAQLDQVRQHLDVIVVEMVDLIRRPIRRFQPACALSRRGQVRGFLGDGPDSPERRGGPG
jgi:hypothetical protein